MAPRCGTDAGFVPVKVTTTHPGSSVNAGHGSRRAYSSDSSSPSGHDRFASYGDGYDDGEDTGDIVGAPRSRTKLVDYVQPDDYDIGGSGGEEGSTWQRPQFVHQNLPSAQKKRYSDDNRAL